MKKRIVFLFTLALIAGGCSTVENVTALNRINSTKLSVGMDKSGVFKIMGHRTRVIQTDLFTSLTINNPYRSEILQGKDKTFEVFYYATDDRYEDGTISDDDLTPFVFADKKLIGWGRIFLKEIIKNNEIGTAGKAKKSKSGGAGFGKTKKGK
jgi:hypothetical protein